MARIKLTLETQLKKYKISKERFEQEKKALRDLNYSSEQAETLIFRGSSANTVRTLIRLHAQLIRLGETPETTLNHQDLCKIASFNGGSNNLEAFMHHYPVLLRSGFTKAEIIKIVAHDGGSKNLEAVQNALEALQALHFTKEEVVKMVAHTGGSKNLEAVQQALPALQALHFTKEDVVKMVAHTGGSKNLEAVQQALPALQALHFTKEDVVKIVAHGGGSKNLEAVQQALPALQALHFTKEDVVTMVSHDGGSKNLEAVREYYEELVQKGYSQNDIRAQLTLNVKRQALGLFSKGQSLKARELFLIVTPSKRPTQELAQTTQELAQILSSIKKRERPFDDEQRAFKKPRFFSERSESISIKSVEQEGLSAQSIGLQHSS